VIGVGGFGGDDYGADEVLGDGAEKVGTCREGGAGCAGELDDLGPG